MTPRGPSRVAVFVAAVLAAAWMAISSVLHARLASALFGPVRDHDAMPELDFACYGLAGLLLVGVPAFFAGVAAVSTTRHPGTGPGLWWAARLAFWASLTGPAEALLVGLWWGGLLAFRFVARVLL